MMLGFLVFEMGLTTLLAQLVSILTAKLKKVVMKSKTTSLLALEPCSHNVHFKGCDIFFSPSNYLINKTFHSHHGFVRFIFLIKRLCSYPSESL